MRIVTHNSHYHPDDLFAVSALLLKFPEAEVVRSRDPEVIESGDIVVDVGFIYDPKKLRFDHHQKGGAGERPNGVPYASFGLVWKEFGEEIAGGHEEARLIDERLGMPIDGNDNAMDISIPVISGVREYTIQDYFFSFAQDAETSEEFDRAFSIALPMAKSLLEREIASAKHAVESWRIVKEIYNESEDKHIIVVPGGLRWKRALIPTEALFAVFPRPDGKWSARAVPKEHTSFEVKKQFPASWAGVGPEMLVNISGVPNAVFCHRDTHLAVATTKEGAIKLAEIALNS